MGRNRYRQKRGGRDGGGGGGGGSVGGRLLSPGGGAFLSPGEEDELEGFGGVDVSSSLGPLLKGVVKIFTTFTEPNFSQPWSMRMQHKSTASGFIVDGRRIMTNAHAVVYQTSVQVRKHGDATKYTARVLAVAHAVDVAIITVDDAEFWKDAVELEFGTMPRLQQEVFVAGYPVGGETLSLTGGVVSRIDFDSYAHSTREHLICGVDAAINPGNSGGPVFSRGKVVGIAFQSLMGAEGTGYIIPAPVAQHVLDDLARHGKLTGFARLGFVYQGLENVHLKAYLKIPKGVTGIHVMKVLPLSNLHGKLLKNDVVTAIDGKVIADDGTVQLRDDDRIAVGYVLTNKFLGDPINLTVWRNGSKVTLTSTVEDVPDLVPPTLYEGKPQYLVHGGLVFTACTEPFVESAFGAGGAPLKLITAMTEGEMQTVGQQVVVLADLLSHPINVGYDDDEYVGSTLVKVNDTKIHNMVDAALAIREARGEWITFEFDSEAVLVLPLEASRAATGDILRQHSIPTPMSADLAAVVGEGAATAGAGATAISTPAPTPTAAGATTPASTAATPLVAGMATPATGTPAGGEGAGTPAMSGGHGDEEDDGRSRSDSRASTGSGKGKGGKGRGGKRHSTTSDALPLTAAALDGLTGLTEGGTASPAGKSPIKPAGAV